MDDAKSLTVLAVAARDANKSYRVREMDVLAKAHFALRVATALRVPNWEYLARIVRAALDKEDREDDVLDALLGILRCCDPDATHALIVTALDYVDVAPDPRHPEAWRKLAPAEDIREQQTLGAVLMAFGQLNLGFQG